MRRVAVGIDREQMIQMDTGLFVIFVLNIDLSQRLVGSRVPGLKGQRGFELLDGLVGLAEPEVQCSLARNAPERSQDPARSLA